MTLTTMYFDTDRYNVDSQDAAALQGQAQYFARYPQITFTTGTLTLASLLTTEDLSVNGGTLGVSGAADIDATTWAQFFLKFILGHPAVTCAIPATSKPKHLLDNMQAGFGRLPDTATRERMAKLVRDL